MPALRTNTTVIALALASALVTLNASAQVVATDTFVDVTATHVPQFPKLHGVDSVMIDADKDGDLDIVVAVENGANMLYLNDGKGRLTLKAGVFGTLANDNEHVRAADFNGDGIMDIMTIAEADEQHHLYFGSGKGTFIDMTARLPRTSQGNGIAIGDVNGDGLPDIILGNTPEDKPGPARDFLWLNDKSRPGHFNDVSAANLPLEDSHTQDIALADMDGDGDLDMILASQSPPNRLLLNDGRGKFTDASDRLELKVPLETREVRVFDANRDGLPDIVFFNLTSNNKAWDKDPQTRLLINDGKGRFKDETGNRLPSHRFSSWGGTIIDFNHDGAPDMLVSAIEVPGFVPQQVRAWQNDGRGNFKDVTQQVIPASTKGHSWSMAQGDLDGDGKPDVFIGGWASQSRLLLTNKALLGEAAATAVR